jgi:hypothetical protein
MIGPAEIEELMSEYAEALKKEGTNVPAETLTWPPTSPSAPTQQARPNVRCEPLQDSAEAQRKLLRRQHRGSKRAPALLARADEVIE